MDAILKPIVFLLLLLTPSFYLACNEHKVWEKAGGTYVFEGRKIHCGFARQFDCGLYLKDCEDKNEYKCVTNAQILKDN